MIFRFAFFVALVFAFASCTNTDFQAWEGGNWVVQGHGGTRKVVDGMVWTHGDPPRRFQVLGIIEDEGAAGMIPMAQLKHGRFRLELRLTSCSAFRQTASMEAEIDCRLQSNCS
jgi:hypothetical protein